MLKKLFLILFLSSAAFATVTSTETKRQYFTCNGSTTTYTFTAPCNSSDDIKVEKMLISTGDPTTLTEDTHYTITYTGSSYLEGGVVTIDPALAATYQVIITREIVRTQETASGAINPVSVVAALDKLTRIGQDARNDIEQRVIKIPDSDPSTAYEALTDYVSRKGYWLGFDSSTGAPLVGTPAATGITVSSFMATVNDDNSAALAMNTLNGISVYNVKNPSYGATGDGSTDDTAAIQAAIDAANAASGGIVYFPASSTSYVISSRLTLYSDITLLGDNFATSTIFLKASSDSLMVYALARDNIKILNLTFDGNNDNGNTDLLFRLRACHNTEVARCKLTNTDSHAISLISSTTRTCENNTFHHNIIEDTGGIGIKITGVGDDDDTEDVLYTKANYNFFYDTDYSAIEVYGQYCHYAEIIGNIAFECVTGVYEAENGCSDVIIADNIAIGTIEHASLGNKGTIRVGGESGTEGKRFVVENNLIIGDSTEEAYGIIASGAEDVIIRGNQVYDIGATDGAAIYISTGCDNVQVLNNYIEDSEYKGIYVAADNERIIISGNIVIDTVQESIGSKSPAIITNNWCDEAGTSGIYLQSAASRSIVSGNICKNANNGESGTRAGIHLADVSYCVITGNICFDDQDSETQDYGIYSTGTSALNIIRNNELSDNKTGAVSLVGANYTDDTVGIVTFTSTDATPSVSASNIFITAGTTTITDFDDGYTGKIITIIGASSLTITDGTNIILDGSANMSMTSGDVLMLVQKSDTYWYQISEANNN